ncbi:beta strand repeat-containing protein [Cellulomonas sp. NPDC057328]|uniref:beta strand repeat-containing protein n=1 Tax=Cellulomonas sp. NPDC057328 TaxID=3346101 RepID=UPI0036331FC7
MQLWLEDFEASATPAQLGTYASNRYTAAAFWLNYANCNGVILNYATTFPATGFCGTATDVVSRNQVRRMADVLGQQRLGVVGGTSNTAPANGSTTGAAGSQANRAVAALTMTGGTTTANQTLVESVAPVGLTATADRYYAASVDVAEDSCSARPGGLNNNSRLDVALVSGGTVSPLTAAPIIACNVTGGRYTSPALTGGFGTETSVRAGRFFTDRAVRLTAAQAAQARIRVSNQISASDGNDLAIDNLRIVDATPSLDKAFATDVGTAGTATTLTFTVTNTAELAAKSDWNFTDALPQGLVVAPTPGVGGTCANVTGTAFAVQAGAGATSIVVTGGDLAAGAVSCTITVNVVATTPGTYVNGPANVTTVLDAPESATFVAEAPARLTIRKNVTGRAVAGDQFRLALSLGATEVASATTTGATTGLQTAQVGPVNVTRGSVYTISESVVSTATLSTYTTSYQCLRGTTTIATGTSVSGPITIPDEAGAEIVCTFTNTPQAATLYCDGTYYYAVRTDGSVVQVNATSSVAPTQLVGAVTGATDVNALGVSAGGTSAVAVDRTGTTAANAGGVVTYTVAGGSLQGTRTALTAAQGAFLDRTGAALDGTIIAGAVDPLNGRFVVGKSAAGSVRLWEYTPTSLTNGSRFLYLGQVATGTTAGENGDISFDAQGNLHIVQTAADSSNVGMFSVTRESLLAASGGTIAASATVRRALSGTDTGAALTSVNGMAFSPTGTVFLGNATTGYQFDPTTWVRVPGSPRATLGTTAPSTATDLAGCSTPSTISVEKNVVGRVNAADQFRLALSGGSPLVESSAATTSGSTTGVQSARVGPTPVQISTSVTISETMAAGSVSPLTAYTSVYECWADGVRIATGTTKSAAVTIPNRLSVGVACTFTNSPAPFATVRVTKVVEDWSGGNRTPAAGWTMTTTATANAGSTVSTLPARNPSQQTGADGSATWQVLFGAASHRGRVTVAETAQTGFRYQSLACTVNGAAAATTVTTAGNQVRGVVNVDVAPGGVVDCVYTNRPVATLTLVKDVSFGGAAPSSWQLAATRSVPTALPGPGGAGGSATVSAVTVSAETPYRLSETGGPATYVQVGGWSCVTASGTGVPVTAAGDVTLTRGSDVTCTVTNATATLTLLKNVLSPSTGFQPSTWNLTATPAALPGLSATTVPGADLATLGNPASTFDVRPGHTYVLSEALAQSGTRLAYQQLRLEVRQPGGGWTPVTSPTITAPAPGQNAVYRFVNAPVQPPVLPLTGGTSTDAFLLGGSAALVLALAIAAWHRRRPQRGGVT